MNNAIELLNTKFNNLDIVNQYVDFINANKLPQDTDRSDVHYEVHHILPKSLFPEYEYEPTNLVKLKLYDHYVAHYIIAKTKDPKMLYAFNMMSRAKKAMTDDQLAEAAEMYAEHKQEFIEMVREQALQRPPMAQETRDKLRDYGQGKVIATNADTGVRTRIAQEEYYANPEKYVHHMTGTHHSEETKQKMSENGIKGKVCYYNIKTLETRYEDESFAHPEWLRGNPVQAALAHERFKDMLHWTNTVTGESTRSTTCPGENWIQKRTNFKNAFEGKAMMFDIRTGEKVLIDKDDIKNYHKVWNSVLVESDTQIFSSIELFIKSIGVDVKKFEFCQYMKGKAIPKKYSEQLDKIDLSAYKVTNAKSLKYPHNKEII
ncbi:mobile endonuclease [Acinetobacter phage AM101]|uniref:Mobile endonuclease n=1 Tax=Acinetobacter phage AM101 TaxID=2178927 RepID=A0A4Y1NMQ8_9CAUD|nr:HNH endonuclease [Acinetobacter phage AM101]AWY10344.1 mobile endonuclease [Acinetobacter phage AM101]